MKMLFNMVSFSLAVLLVLAPAGPAAAATWLGIDTNWNNTANWSGGTVPADGDIVVIPNLPNDPTMPATNYPVTGAFASFDVQAGAVVTCLGDTNVINEASGGADTNKHGIGVTINVSGDATIAGTLTADSKGFPGLRGPGKGIAASHGGRGNYNGSFMGTNLLYGSLTNPTALGSGGNQTLDLAICSGGGAIKLNAGGTLTLNGTITANAPYDGNNGGCGSGGSIWIICNTFAGTGVVSAIGQRDYYMGQGGGGGRVAIEYNTKTFSGSISVAGGKITLMSKSGQAGTLWEPQRFEGVEGSAGSPVNMTITNSYQYFFTNGTPTYYWNLTVTNAWFELHRGRVAIRDLVLTNASVLRFDDRGRGGDAFDMYSLSVTNSITVLTNSALYLPVEGAYDLAGDLNIATGGYVYAFGNTTNVNEASGGTTNNPHGIGVTINVGGNATIAGTLSGQNYGFPVATGPGYSGGSVGGTYGGVGGNSASRTYGQLTQPTALGSGGYDGGSGGGSAIKLSVAGTLRVDGTIGVQGKASYGTGSGGSLWLLADTLEGGGAINADGGIAVVYGSSRSGGGGRIALDYRASTFTGIVSASNSLTGTTSQDGKTGTWFNCVSPFRGTSSTGGYAGVCLASVFNISSNGVKIARVVTRWDASNLAWSEQSTAFGGAALTNTVNYTLTGLTPQVRYCIYTNDYPMRSDRSSAAGMLTISNFALSGISIAIRVETPPKGTIVSVW